ncbi:putative glucan synthasis protein [Corynebacterium mustelae]|uniref:Putative glucan synthasis protein n=1 Tax=Corynebacterium mustelae TaxID=571915 RepID=A0A0G3H111_9CORY|nr:SMI1/KNR4 family protein [Corynebacterium mustelae]AKK06450.1 putative glucan synthasis protein [Corynebacterium mustelae]
MTSYLRTFYETVTTTWPTTPADGQPDYGVELPPRIPTPATEDTIAAVVSRYPLAPPELLCLLREADGTWHKGDFRGFLVFFREVDGYVESACLNSCQDILDYNETESLEDYYGMDTIRAEGESLLDPRIDPTIPMNQRMWIGTDRVFYDVYLDFNPAEGGKVGQVVWSVHDADEWRVIAPSFADYLSTLEAQAATNARNYHP